MFTVLTQYGGSILGPIAKVLGWIMNLIYNLMYTLFGTGNIALSIIIFTIVVYMLLLPLTWQQQKFSVLQRKMKPELDAIQRLMKEG